MLLQKVPQRFRHCNFSLDVHIKQEKMNDDTIFVPVRMPSGMTMRVRVTTEVAQIMERMLKENPQMEESDALSMALKEVKSRQSGDAQQ